MHFSNHQAIYLQIADRICDSILEGMWLADDRIPSVREMAVQIEVNPNTVARAYNHLQSQGIIFNKRGIGYFIAEKAHDIVLQEKSALFLETELPRIFREMLLLNIRMEEIQTHYERYVEKEKKNEAE